MEYQAANQLLSLLAGNNQPSLKVRPMDTKWTAPTSKANMPRPYKCPLCPKSFYRLEHQTRHIRTHTGEKPHQCHFTGCEKRFSRSDELTRHVRIHTSPTKRRPRQQSTLQKKKKQSSSSSPTSAPTVSTPPSPVMSTGEVSDVEYLFTPDNSPTLSPRHLISPMNKKLTPLECKWDFTIQPGAFTTTTTAPASTTYDDSLLALLDRPPQARTLPPISPFMPPSLTSSPSPSPSTSSLSPRHMLHT
ncbi:hypothetical protein [Absidia glauca]|uniref:C2H2-type domain-containing protein n=1 Tax=Absidia glauca TaxID=4829 RepID=A0A163J250_ABSGL|nr:hypothetical protein [Absidia glauca]